MVIVVGSTNRTKIGAVKDVFKDIKVLSAFVSSGVSSQPMSDAETRHGAIHRAIEAQKLHERSFGIGLEGGVMILEESLYLCNWGALVTPDGKLYTASGARIKLPDAFLPLLKQGQELSELMENYTRKKGIRNKEGAIGIFTNNMLPRTEMFAQVVRLLKGQMDYWETRGNEDTFIHS